MSEKRDARDLRKALREQALEDDVDEVTAMSDEALDRFIDAHGGDAKEIRASSQAFAAELMERRKRLAWHGEMEEKLASFRKKADEARIRQKLPRKELLARLELARNDPRWAAPIAALFSKKSTERATDEELTAMLEEIELLAKLEDE